MPQNEKEKAMKNHFPRQITIELEKMKHHEKMKGILALSGTKEEVRKHQSRGHTWLLCGPEVKR
jgi:hypothetical protein